MPKGMVFFWQRFLLLCHKSSCVLKGCTNAAMEEHMATKDVLDGFLTKADLAQQFGKSERTLDRWAALRTGPPRTVIGQTTL